MSDLHPSFSVLAEAYAGRTRWLRPISRDMLQGMDEETLRRITREELAAFAREQLAAQAQQLPDDDERPKQYIKEWREKRGLTVEQLGDEADIPPFYIAEAEEGVYMQRSRMNRIAEVLQIPPAMLNYPPPRELPQGVIDMWERRPIS